MVIISFFRNSFYDAFGFYPNFTTIEQFYYSLSGTDPTYGDTYPEVVLEISGATCTQMRGMLGQAGIEDPELFTSLIESSGLLANLGHSTSWNYCLTPVVDQNLNLGVGVHNIIISSDEFPATGQLGGNDTGYFDILQKRLTRFENIQFRSSAPTWMRISKLSFNENHTVPASATNPTKDILGDVLEYKGQVLYPALLKQSNCVNLDGVDDYVEFNNVVDWDSIEHQGTSVLSLDLINKRITGTAGTAFDIKIKNVSGEIIAHYPMAEGTGTRISDASGNNNHGILLNASATPVWSKQDHYHYNFNNGFKVLTYNNSLNGFDFNSTMFNIGGTGSRSLEFEIEMISGFDGGDRIGFSDRFTISYNNILIAYTELSFSFTSSVVHSIVFDSPIEQGTINIFKIIKSDLNEYSLELNGVLQQQKFTVVEPSIPVSFVGFNMGTNSTGTAIFRFNYVTYIDSSNTVELKADRFGVLCNDQYYPNLRIRPMISTSPYYLAIQPHTPIPLDIAEHPDFQPYIVRFPSGRHHNGAETQINFSGGVASPYAKNLPTAYNIGDVTIDHKEVSATKESNLLIYDSPDAGEIIEIDNYTKEI